MSSFVHLSLLPLPLLELGSKSTSLSPGFSVHSPRQYDTICFGLNLISEFFAFFWLIVWVDGINNHGWCLAGGRGCWLQGPHQIPSVSWIYSHSLRFHIYQIASFVPGILCSLYCYYKWQGDGLGGRWLIYNRVWEGDRGWVLSCSFYFCFLSLVHFVLCSLMSWSFFLSDWSMIAVVSVSLFFISFLCFWSL